MSIKVKAFAAYRDGQDGSCSVSICGTRELALENLDRTEEQLQQGNMYEDGAIDEIEIEVEQQADGTFVLINAPYFSFG